MIFILDDNADDLELLSKHLKKNGIFNTRFFTDGDQFFEELTKTKVVIVIIDHHITPNKVGLEFVIKVLDFNPACYVIVISGNNDPNIILQYMNNDGFRFVLKSNPDYLNLLVKYIRTAQHRIQLIANFLKNGR